MRIINNLGDIEVMILEKLKEAGGKRKLEVLARELAKTTSTIASIIENLAKKGAVAVVKKKLISVSLTNEGLKYARYGLPERKVLQKLIEMGGRAPIRRLASNRKIGEEIKVAIGWAKKKGWIKIEKKGAEQIVQVLIENPPEGYDEKILKELSQSSGSIFINKLDYELYSALQDLKTRKLVVIKEKTDAIIFLTSEGKEMLAHAGEKQVINVLAREHIIKGTWRKCYFKQYNVTAQPPRIYPGKQHFLNEIIDRVRQTLLFMGFEECFGKFIELEFWSFDMLFYAQDHPSRSLSEVYWIKKPEEGNILDKELIDKVKAVHEHGWITGSRGWGGKWSLQRSKKLILSIEPLPPIIRYLFARKKTPIKAFCILRTFKREMADADVPMESIKLGGMYCDEDANMSKLIGIIKKILLELEISEVKVRPTYLSYAEPSIEVRIKQDKENWLSCAVGGFLRPEIGKVLDLEMPAVIWSMNLNDIAIACLNLSGYREIYASDLNVLRRLGAK